MVPCSAFQECFDTVDRLSAVTVAEGFFDLGMWQDAWAELEQLPAPKHHLKEVITLRILILNRLEDWEAVAALGYGALQRYRDSSELRWASAEAAHKSGISEQAKASLLDGKPALSSIAEFYFSLACLEAELGEVQSATVRLWSGLKIDTGLWIKALNEPALKAVWKSILRGAA